MVHNKCLVYYNLRKHVASITITGIFCNENFPELETQFLSSKKLAS